MIKIFRVIISLFFLFGLINPTYADIKKIKNELSDSVITAKLTAKFTQNKKLNPLKISITTENGKVILTGNVNNKDALTEAVRVTKSTKGVKSIDIKHLEIKPVNTVFTDVYITAKVEAMLLKTKVLHDESIPLVAINVKTTNGVVTLSGEVKKTSSIKIIIDKVKQIQGVKKVISHLIVNAKKS